VQRRFAPATHQRQGPTEPTLPTTSASACRTIEATGRLEHAFVSAAIAKGLPVVIIAPLKVRRSTPPGDTNIFRLTQDHSDLLCDSLAMKLHIESHSGGWHNFMSYSWLYHSVPIW
jgi:hypothetical protein